MFFTEKRFHIFTINNIPIKIDISWVLVFLLVSWSLSANYFPHEFPKSSPILYWIWGIITAFLLFLSILIHELGHSIVAKMTGLPIKEITLFIFGGVAHMGEEPSEPLQEFKIAVAGPFMSLLLAIFFGGGYFLIQKYIGYTPTAAIFRHLAFINVVIIVFNLAPGLPLDGGRVLRAFIWYVTKDLSKATRLSSWMGEALGVLLILLGIYLTISGFSFQGIWFFVIGVFLVQAAKSAYESLFITNILEKVTAWEAMTVNPITVPAEINLSQLVKEYFMKHPYRNYPVVREENGKKEVLGVVSLNHIIDIDKEDWDNITVEEIVNAKSLKCPYISPNTSLKEAMKIMVQDGLPYLLVVKDGNLVGVISRHDIMNTIAIRSALIDESS